MKLFILKPKNLSITTSEKNTQKLITPKQTRRIFTDCNKKTKIKRYFTKFVKVLNRKIQTSKHKIVANKILNSI